MVANPLKSGLWFSQNHRIHGLFLKRPTSTYIYGYHILLISVAKVSPPPTYLYTWYLSQANDCQYVSLAFTFLWFFLWFPLWICVLRSAKIPTRLVSSLWMRSCNSLCRTRSRSFKGPGELEAATGSNQGKLRENSHPSRETFNLSTKVP